MHKLMIVIADILLAAARNRAEQVMHKVSTDRMRQADVYSSNMGGWN
ncbi:MAG: hypothetical protein ABWY05_14735 [Noviherbaspirillum sp.]